MPNAPPTSSVMTRNFSFGTPMMAAAKRAQRVGALRAGVERVAVIRLVVYAGGPARLHGRHHHALVGDTHFGNVRRLGDRFGNITLVLLVRDRALPVDAEIAGRFGVELGAAFIIASSSVNHGRSSS